MMGFAIIGFLSFGAQNQFFSTLSEAVMECIYALVGQFNIKDYTTTKSALLVLWGLAYMVNKRLLSISGDSFTN